MLRKELKPIVRPHNFSVAVPPHSSIDITIKGVGLVADDYDLTPEGQRVQDAAHNHANRYNYDPNPPDYMGDPLSPNFYLDVKVRNHYSRAEIEAEAHTLREVYTITDEATLNETHWSITLTPLMSAAMD